MNESIFITFVKLKTDMTAWTDKIFEWENDLSSRHLFAVWRSEEEFRSNTVTQEDILQRLERRENSSTRFMWGLLAGRQTEGIMDAAIDSLQMHNPEPGTNRQKGHCPNQMIQVLHHLSPLYRARINTCLHPKDLGAKMMSEERL